MIVNLLNEQNARTPNYDLSGREMYFDVYMSYDKTVCIAHCYDNNYVGGVYMSSLDRADELREIFHHCLYNRPTLAQSVSHVLKADYQRITSFLNVRIQKEYFAHADEMRFRVEGSNCFMGDEKTDRANYIVQELCRLYETAQGKIQVLLMSKGYGKTLEQYCDILTRPHADYTYYHQCAPIGNVLKEQNYMRLCKDDRIRTLFIAAQDAMDRLYSEYMSAVR